MWEPQSSRRFCRWPASRETPSSSSGSGRPSSSGFCHDNFWLMKLKLYEILNFMKCWFQDCRRVLRVLPFSKTWRWWHRLGGASRGDRQQHDQPHGERLDKVLHSHYDQQQDHQPQFNSICFSPIWKLAKCLYVRASRHQLQMLKNLFFEIQWKPFQPHG